MGGTYGETLSTDQRREYEEGLGEDGVEDSDDMPTTLGRRQRSGGKEAFRAVARGISRGRHGFR